MGTNVTFSDISIASLRAKDSTLGEMAEAIDGASKKQDGKINAGSEFIDLCAKAKQHGYTEENLYEAFGLDIKNKDKINVYNWNAAKNESLEKLKQYEQALLEETEKEWELNKDSLEKQLNKLKSSLYQLQSFSEKSKPGLPIIMHKTFELWSKYNEKQKQECLQILEEVEKEYEAQKISMEEEYKVDKERIMKEYQESRKEMMRKDIEKFGF